MEKWKDIPNFEGLYEASNKGRIRTKKGKTTYRWLNGKKQKRVWKSRILKEKNPSGRDKRVSLWKNGNHRDYLVHRLVAMAFIPNPNNYPCINHIDGDPRNNNLNNLEWCTYEMNANHAFNNGLMNTNIKIMLIEKQTGNRRKFRSMSKAAQFLGKNHGYISGLLDKNKNETDKYLIKVDRGD